MKKIEYPFTIRRLSKADGGGWLVEFPDLPGCIADGETIEEAVENGSDALRSWLATAKEFKDPVLGKLLIRCQHVFRFLYGKLRKSWNHQLEFFKYIFG